NPHRYARAAGRGFPDLGRLCRLLPHGLECAGAVICRTVRFMTSFDASPSSAARPEPDTRRLRMVRLLLPLLVLAAGVVLWELVVRLNNIPAYVLPGPGAVFRTLVQDWPVLSQSLLTTLLTTLEGFVAAGIGGIILAVLFNQSKWLEYSLIPYAVILQVTPVIAIAPLLLIYLPQPTAVVAGMATGSAGAGSGLAYRIAESGYRLNIPRMFAALLLLSAAGIVIYGLLALASHLTLRHWHESALGKVN